MKCDSRCGQPWLFPLWSLPSRSGGGLFFGSQIMFGSISGAHWSHCHKSYRHVLLKPSPRPWVLCCCPSRVVHPMFNWYLEITSTSYYYTCSFLSFLPFYACKMFIKIFTSRKSSIIAFFPHQKHPMQYPFAIQAISSSAFFYSKLPCFLSKL